MAGAAAFFAAHVLGSLTGVVVIMEQRDERAFFGEIASAKHSATVLLQHSSDRANRHAQMHKRRFMGYDRLE